MDILLNNILNLIETGYKCDSDFEKDLGIARSTVSAWRKGKLKSYNKMLPAIANHFHVSVDYLLGNEQNKKSNTIGYEFGDKEKAVLERLNKIKALSEEDYELAIAQLDLIIKRREDKNNK